MARKDGKRENQHYVPKLLLRNFISNVGAKRGSERIWAYDKLKDVVANPNIKNIAAQYGFYDLGAGANCDTRIARRGNVHQFASSDVCIAFRYVELERLQLGRTNDSG